MHYELLCRPAYSPNLAKYMYYLFESLKFFQVKGFDLNEEEIADTKAKVKLINKKALNY